jgi:hypothetical protein
MSHAALKIALFINMHGEAPASLLALTSAEAKREAITLHDVLRAHVYLTAGIAETVEQELDGARLAVILPCQSFTRKAQ